MAKAKASRLTLEEAAEYLGMAPEDLMRSRWRGTDPGRLGYKVEGALYFNRADLPKPARAAKAEEAVPDED